MHLLVLPEVFDGDKSLEQWVSHFENVVAINGWNDRENFFGWEWGLQGKHK